MEVGRKGRKLLLLGKCMRKIEKEDAQGGFDIFIKNQWESFFWLEVGFSTFLLAERFVTSAPAVTIANRKINKSEAKTSEDVKHFVK